MRPIFANWHGGAAPLRGPRSYPRLRSSSGYGPSSSLIKPTKRSGTLLNAKKPTPTAWSPVGADRGSFRRWPTIAVVLDHGVAGPLRAAWLRPRQTDLIPDKGQFRSRFPPSAQLSAIVVRQRFFGIFWPFFLAGSERLRDNRRMTDAAHNQHSATAARAIATARGPSRSSPPVQKCCAEMMSVSVARIRKNRCRTTIAERMVETRAGTALYRGSGRFV